MSAHLERARLLLAQSRPADAEQETMRALSAQPGNPEALSLLALTRVEQDKRAGALEAAREAVSLAPDAAYLHFVHAHVLHRMDRTEEAFRAVQEALRLDPDDADHFALLASIELARRRWPAALEAAERALQRNAEHVGAANLRSMALVRLGRKDEAMATVEYALHRSPDDAFSHANQGWNCLHRNDPAKAQEHFREALRLDPNLEYAREGMVEALKARNPVYRVMLAYFLWMGRQSARLQWALILGIFFGSGVIRSLSLAQPQLNWLWWPLLAAFYLFVYLSWTAQPMFDLLLRLNRFGRHVLSAEQRTATNWFGPLFAAAFGCFLWWMVTQAGEPLFATIVLAAISICVAATFRANGRNRLILGVGAAGLAATAGAAAIFLLRGDEAGLDYMNAFKFGFIGFQVLANSLSGK